MSQRRGGEYSSQVVLSVFPEESKDAEIAESINFFTQKKRSHLHSTLVHLNLENIKAQSDTFSSLNRLQSDGRLYIAGHGHDADTDYIYCINDVNTTQKINYKDLALFLATKLTEPELKDPNHQPRLKISLVMCESAGFARKLHAELGKYGIYCEVSARVPEASVFLDGYQYVGEQTIKTKGTRSLIDADNRDVIHNRPYTKVVYTWDEKNQQNMHFAHDLKSDSLKIIANIKSELENKISKMEVEPKGNDAIFIKYCKKLKEQINAIEIKLAESEFPDNGGYYELIKNECEGFRLLYDIPDMDYSKTSDHLPAQVVHDFTVEKLRHLLNERFMAYGTALQYNENPRYKEVQEVGASSSHRIVLKETFSGSVGYDVSSDTEIDHITSKQDKQDNKSDYKLAERNILETIDNCVKKNKGTKRLLVLQRDLKHARGDFDKMLEILKSALDPKDPSGYQLNQFKGIFNFTASRNPEIRAKTKSFLAVEKLYNDCIKFRDNPDNKPENKPGK